MNLTLKDVYQTSADGEQFWKMEEIYVRGSSVRLSSSLHTFWPSKERLREQIKYIRVAEAIIDQVKEQEAEYRARGGSRGGMSGGRGGSGGPNRGGGDRGRGRGGRGGPPRGRGGKP